MITRFNYDIIPQDLKELNQWVGFTESKTPIDPQTLRGAKAKIKTTWGTFEEAINSIGKMGTYYKNDNPVNENIIGVGFEFNDNGIVGIDLDHVLDADGNLHEKAELIYQWLNSYTEISPSGTGLHIFVYGDIPVDGKNKRNGLEEGKGIEVYKAGHYLTMTGNVFRDPKPIEHRGAEIRSVYDEYFLQQEPPQQIILDLEPAPTCQPNGEQFDRGLMYDKVFASLWDGERRSDDESSNDQALMNKLAYWCDNDVNLMIEKFRASPFASQKDREHLKKMGRDDYMTRTAKEAVKECSRTARDDHKPFTPYDQGHSITYDELEPGTDDQILGIETKKETPTEKNVKYSKQLYQMFVEIKPEVAFTWDDKGFGDLFAMVYRNKFRYNATSKNWMFYNGKIWKNDTGEMRADAAAKRFATALNAYSSTVPALEDASGKATIKYSNSVKSLGKRNRRDAILKDARSVYFLTNEDLDKDIFSFNCQNGTLDLKTFEFKKHDPNDLLSRISSVIYDPNAKSPDFEKFIDDIMMGDTEKIKYIQKLLGHSLTGDVKMETCFILYGPSTRNGKSTLVETYAVMLGGDAGYSTNMSPDTLAQKKNNDGRQASGDIARLNGCRFLNAPEPRKRMIFDVALLKLLLGRDTLTARQLYEREFEFKPMFKLFINTNTLPVVTDDTLFSSGRVNVILFERHFTPDEQDQDLKSKLETPENLSGIFNWCLEGLKLFYQEGAQPPASVKAATQEYKESSDKMGNFLSECFRRAQGTNTKCTDAYTVYENWCKANGYGVENKQNFFSELKTKGVFAEKGTVDGKTCRNIIKNMELMNDDPDFFTDIMGLTPVNRDRDPLTYN